MDHNAPNTTRIHTSQPQNKRTKIHNNNNTMRHVPIRTNNRRIKMKEKYWSETAICQNCKSYNREKNICTERNTKMPINGHCSRYYNDICTN